MKNKLLTALLSVGIALVLWLYVVTVVSPNSDNIYKNVPITLQGEAVLQDRGLMITSGELPTVSLHLEGNRTDLNKINSSNISIGVDVSGIGEPGTYNLTLTQPNFLTDVPNTAVTVLSKDPSTVTVVVAKRISKPVPVDIKYNGTLPENYMADKENLEQDYLNVTVSGPQEVVDQIAMARIEVDLDNRIESITGRYAYTLCNEKGEPVDAQMIVTDVEAVNLTLKVVRVKEVALSVNVVDGGGATEEACKITLDPEVILVSGSDQLLENFDTLELGTINLSEIEEDGIVTFPIKLPEDKITVTVDFSGEQAGTASIKAQITVSVAGVGAVGVYNVTASVKAK